MTDDIPDVYELISPEQIRIASDATRTRIMQPLILAPMTVTQVGELLGIAPARVHYHVRELERVGMVRMVETREKGGILEKYYRAAGKNFLVPPSLLQTEGTEEHVAAVTDVFHSIMADFMRAVSRSPVTGEDIEHHLQLAGTVIWVTSEEWSDLMDRIGDLVDRYGQPRGIDGEMEHSFFTIAYPTVSSGVDAKTTETVRHFTAGIAVIEKEELERLVDRGQRAEIDVYGICRVASDVTPELADAAIARFHHRGILSASPAVREILRQKEETSP